MYTSVTEIAELILLGLKEFQINEPKIEPSIPNHDIDKQLNITAEDVNYFFL